MSDYWAWQDYWLRDDEDCSCCQIPKISITKKETPIQCSKCKILLKKEEHASNILCDKCFFEGS